MCNLNFLYPLLIVELSTVSFAMRMFVSRRNCVLTTYLKLLSRIISLVVVLILCSLDFFHVSSCELAFAKQGFGVLSPGHKSAVESRRCGKGLAGLLIISV